MTLYNVVHANKPERVGSVTNSSPQRSLMSSQSVSWLRLTHLVSNVETQLGKALQRKHGIGLTEYRALQHLAMAPQSELRMQELASHLQLNQSSATRLAERLERAQYTTRGTCPNGKRGVYIVLTAQGQKRLNAARPDYEKLLRPVIDETAGRSLEKLFNAVQPLPEHA